MRPIVSRLNSCSGLGLLLVLLILAKTHAEDQRVDYKGNTGPGHGKRIVLISGDEEYRSEEALPQLGKILARHHGFKCTVLFAIEDGREIPSPGGKAPNLVRT